MSTGMPAGIWLTKFGTIVSDYFGHECYHVGSSLTSKDWRDVDVRLILPDAEFSALFGSVHAAAETCPALAAVTLAFSALGQQMTGLPIDFQIQPMTHANERYPHNRSALIEHRGIGGLVTLAPAATAALPVLRAQLAAESPAAPSEGDNTGQGVSDGFRADLLPEAGSRFALVRHADVTGISGTGVVAWGIAWPDGSVDIRWRGARPSSVHWDNLENPIAIHGHGGRTEFVWIDPRPICSLPVDKLTAGTLQAELRVREAVQ